VKNQNTEKVIVSNGLLRKIIEPNVYFKGLKFNEISFEGYSFDIENLELFKKGSIKKVSDGIYCRFTINLDTFIKEASCYFVKYGYNVNFENPWDVKVFNQNNDEVEYFSIEKNRAPENAYDVELILKALEWVDKEVEG